MRAKIPPAFQQLMEPHLQMVDKAIEPGIVKLTWTSITIDSYVSNVHASLAELDLLVKRSNDIVEFRIDAVLHEISTTMLCELPEEEPWTPEDFLERTQVLHFWHSSGFSNLKVAHPSDANLQLTVETCELSQVPPLSV